MRAAVALASLAGAAVLLSLLGRGPAVGPAASFRADPPVDVAGLPVRLADLTWPEARSLVESGARTVIVPTGGIEQNGPHLVLGKHDHVVAATAERTARALGRCLVAPVLSYVPEGGVDPATGHMRYPGTITVPEGVFAAVLDAAAESLRAHGFTLVCFLGDSGGNQAAQAAVAARLNARWAASSARALHVGEYYAANGQAERLRAEGESDAAIGTHAGIRDTSELMAVYPAGVRPDRIRSGVEGSMAGSGVSGDPTRASAERGERMLALKVEAAVRQIRAARGE
jgi:creatinine amidohydrolase